MTGDRIMLHFLDHGRAPVGADLQLHDTAVSVPLQKLLERLAIQLDGRILRLAPVHDGRDLSLPAQLSQMTLPPESARVRGQSDDLGHRFSPFLAISYQPSAFS